MNEKIVHTTAHRLSVIRDGKEVGRAFLFLIHNELHDVPYGLLEDLFVDESYRSQGVGTELIQAVIQKAKELECYKLVATSRSSRTKVHELYQRIGFEAYGTAFRMDLT